MNGEHALKAQFARMGARLKITERPEFWSGTRTPDVGNRAVLDVRHDEDGEFFAIERIGEPSLEILNVQPRDRHLLLLTRDGETSKHKFLCGHDERHWFVAAIPESSRGVGTVEAAKEALKPQAVAAAQARKQVPTRKRNRRKNAAFLRQGEWFFLPDPGFRVPEELVLRNEPIRRGRGKPHLAEFCYRQGGQTVYVCNDYPDGVSEREYQTIRDTHPRAWSWSWRQMRRDPQVYVRGRMRHADHKTLIFRDWHRVLMNTETQAKAMAHLAFLD